MKKVFVFCLFVVAIAACGPKNVVFEQTLDVTGTHWLYADTLNYLVQVSDTNKLYRLVVGVAHDKKYPNQNLYVRISTRFPDGKRLQKLVNFDLADPTGKWLGNCGGSECDFEVPIQEAAFFNQAGEYTFTVEQFMRVDSLNGINAVSFRVEDTGKEK